MERQKRTMSARLQEAVGRHTRRDSRLGSLTVSLVNWPRISCVLGIPQTMTKQAAIAAVAVEILVRKTEVRGTSCSRGLPLKGKLKPCAPTIVPRMYTASRTPLARKKMWPTTTQRKVIRTEKNVGSLAWKLLPLGVSRRHAWLTTRYKP